MYCRLCGGLSSATIIFILWNRDKYSEDGVWLPMWRGKIFFKATKRKRIKINTRKCEQSFYHMECISLRAVAYSWWPAGERYSNSNYWTLTCMVAPVSSVRRGIARPIAWKKGRWFPDRPSRGCLCLWPDTSRRFLGQKCSVFGPSTWNDLPLLLRQKPSLDSSNVT